MLEILINLFWIIVSGILALVAACLSVFFVYKAHQMSEKEKMRETAQMVRVETQECMRPRRRRRYVQGGIV